MKKLLGIIFVVLMSLGVSCSLRYESNIKEVLNESIAKTKTKEYRDIGDITGGNSSDTLSIKFSNEDTKAITEINKGITMKVNSIEIDENNATANITVKSGNLAKVIIDSIDNALMESLFTVSSKSANERFNEQFSKELRKISFTEKSGDISLKKVKDTWELKNEVELLHLVVGEP